ncbi:MAG: hypothetical protein WD845_06175 [Pirellulales bacterium]
MAIETKPAKATLDPAIESLLARLRRRIRAYVVADGLAVTLLALAAGFWISLAIDWLFELPRPLRAAMLAAVVIGVAAIAYRLLASRLLVRLQNRNMAVLLERHFEQFDDGLLTAVELAERPDHAAEFNVEMLDHTRRAARSQLAGVNLANVFNTAPLARRITLAAALAGSLVVFAVAAPEAMGVWTRRNLLFSRELWPRQTHLHVDGFGADGHMKMARGADWTLAVRAEAAAGREIPEVVEVRYSTSDGVRGRENMSREGVVLPGQAEFQPYAHTFKSVLAPLEFYVFGGDDREGPFYLDVVEAPTISRMTLHCEYPAYMHREPRDVPVAGLMQLPRGTRIVIHAQANKPLVAVEIEDVVGETSATKARVEVAEEAGAPLDRFQFDIPPLARDKILLFTLFDADGIRSLDVVRLAIAAVPDEAPQVNVGLKGIGTAITPAARLPVGGEISDDYGVTKAWFDFHADDAAAHQRPLLAGIDGQEKLEVADVLEVGELGLQPKQRFHVAVHAADGCTLESGPNLGQGQRQVLEVVTPEQLRSMLEARELMLRRRFETIIAEFTDTRNMLAALQLSDAPAFPATDGEPEAATELSTEPTLPASVPVARVTQNVERSAHETREVSDAFQGIREEMINNRVDTEELRIRLKEGIADPLAQLVDARFAALQAELGRLADQLSDANAAAPTRTRAVAEMDAILVEMSQVLDKMLELETFNEVLDILREIIAEQEQVTTETKDQQKSKVRDLLE